jgi:hypothetical protein
MPFKKPLFCHASHPSMQIDKNNKREVGKPKIKPLGTRRNCTMKIGRAADKDYSTDA